MYNKQTKERFLKTIENPDTKNFYKLVLEKAEVTEQQRGKDLYDFNTKEQIIDFLNSLGTSTGKSIITMFSPVVKYFEWAIGEGYAPATRFGVIKSITKEKLLSLVSVIKFKGRFIENRKELYYLTEQFCANYQDAVLFILLYNGIDGRKHREIINLKKDDCDFNNSVVKIKNEDNSLRLVKFPDRDMKIIEEASNEKTYKKNNEMISPENRSPELEIPESEYIVRKTNRKKGGQVSPIVINSRLKKISDMYGKSFISPKSVFQSGMIDKCKQIKEQRGFLSSDDYRQIYKMFGLNPNNWFNLKDLYTQYEETYNYK